MNQHGMISLVKLLIEEQGFKAKEPEWEEDKIVIRLLSKSDKPIGSITLRPSWELFDDEMLKTFLKSNVLEACRAAVKEPALKGI